MIVKDEDYTDRRKPQSRPLGLSPAERQRVAAQACQLAEPICAASGIELIHVEFQREANGNTLRLYIDKPGGVMLADCEDFSRQLNDLLDVALDIPGHYSLEVSSPGRERPISKRTDFEKFSGRRVRIRITGQLDHQRQFTGILLGIQEDHVRIQLSDRQLSIPLNRILRARLVPTDGENPC